MPKRRRWNDPVGDLSSIGLILLLSVGSLALSSIFSGCTLRVFAAATTAALDEYTTALIEDSTLEDRAEIKAMLESIKPYTDQAAASVNAKLALIASLEP